MKMEVEGGGWMEDGGWRVCFESVIEYFFFFVDQNMKLRIILYI
jgi:hypothetical protein